MGDLKEKVESKIIKYTMYAKNFNKKEYWDTDKYCKEHYNDNRRQMILDLIRYKEEDFKIKMLDDKIILLYNDFDTRIRKIEDYLITVLKENNQLTEEKKKPTWKGFGDNKK